LGINVSILNAQNQNGQLETLNYIPPETVFTNFTNQNNLLSTPIFNSVLIVAVADMNGDCLDDIIRLDNGKTLTIEYQSAGNQFQSFEYGNVAIGGQWNIAIADVDENGFNDILVGGLMDGMKLLKANDFGTDYEESVLATSSFIVQGSNFVDIDNDGNIDIFVCNDVAESHIWKNEGGGNFVAADYLIDMSTNPPSDNSGNYASVWTDFDNDGDLDLYISKCRVGVTDPLDPRRINQLFVNTDGVYTESAEEFNLNNGAQSWTTDFQDIDNDGDLDCFIVNHGSFCQLFENIGNGMYSEITEQSGLNITQNHLQGIMRDFDNDRFVDILVAGSNGYEYYENNGDNTFTIFNTLFGNYNMGTFAIGDLNHDGFIDVYSGSETDEDILWINEGNENHYFAVNLIGDSSNINGIGARIELYDSLGIQIREVRSGESYGIMNSLTQFFGLGAIDQIDSLVVKWPSGLREVFYSPLVDQFLRIVENDCAYPGKNIFSDGITTFCSGEELDLIAPAGDNYLWSTGDETQHILITEGGSFTVTVTNSNGCSTVSNTIAIIQDPDETPIVWVSGPTTFCFGGGVILTSSEAEGYLWSNGKSAKSINVFHSGEYTVTVPGLCGDFTSEPVIITAIDVPEDPIAIHDTISMIPDIATLGAIGDNLQWFYDDFVDEPFFIGPGFDTLIYETTTFYVEAVNEFDDVVCESDRVAVWAVIDTTIISVKYSTLMNLKI